MHRGAGYGRAAQRLQLKSKRPAIRSGRRHPATKAGRRLGPAGAPVCGATLPRRDRIRLASLDPATAVEALAAGKILRSLGTLRATRPRSLIPRSRSIRHCMGDTGYMAKLKAPNNNKLPDFCCPTIRLQDNQIWREPTLCLKETV